MYFCGIAFLKTERHLWHSLRLGHLVQQVLGDRLLLHLQGDAVGGVVVLHVDQLRLIGRHPHLALFPEVLQLLDHLGRLLQLDLVGKASLDVFRQHVRARPV